MERVRFVVTAKQLGLSLDRIRDLTRVWDGGPCRDAQLGRILAAYGGVVVAGSPAWAMVADGYRPDRHDVAGALICLAGVAVIMYSPRTGVVS